MFSRDSDKHNKTITSSSVIGVEMQINGNIKCSGNLVLKGKVKGMSNDEAYMNIPFEQEAYRKMYDEDYPIKRERHAWRKYIS